MVDYPGVGPCDFLNDGLGDITEYCGAAIDFEGIVLLPERGWCRIRGGEAVRLLVSAGTGSSGSYLSQSLTTSNIVFVMVESIIR
jgi:hypothetical protein